MTSPYSALNPSLNPPSLPNLPSFPTPTSNSPFPFPLSSPFPTIPPPPPAPNRFPSNLNFAQLGIGLGGTSTGGGSVRLEKEKGDPVDLEDCKSGLEEAVRVLERVEVVLGEIHLLERGLFEVGDMVGVSAAGSTSRIEALHQEYTQLLQSLLTLSTTRFFGSLPCPLSSASTSSTESDGTNPTITELTHWAEQRASLEFGRREAVRSAGKAVLEVLKGGVGQR